MLDNPVIYWQLYLVSAFLDHKIIALVFILAVVGFLAVRKYFAEALLFLTTLLSVPLYIFIKGFFKLPRPAGALYSELFSSDQYGFPSGHTVLYTVMFGYLFYLSYKLGAVNKQLRLGVRVLSLYLISFIGFSRVYLGAHYVVDVLGGYLLGLVLLVAIVVLDKNLQKRQDAVGKNQR
jgi:undecaprenyl-diphosphatase